MAGTGPRGGDRRRVPAGGDGVHRDYSGQVKDLGDGIKPTIIDRFGNKLILVKCPTLGQN